MVIHRLRKEIGDEGIRKIHKYFETKYVSQSDLESLFILAMADLENEKSALAEIILKDLETRNSQLEEPVFSEEIDYYLIQSLLQQEKYDEAESRLEKILQDPSHRYFKNFTKSDLWKIRILKLKK